MMSDTLVICLHDESHPVYLILPNLNTDDLALLWELTNIDMNKDGLTDVEEQQLALFQAAIGNDFYEHLPGYCKWKDMEVEVPLLNMNITHVFTITYAE